MRTITVCGQIEIVNCSLVSFTTSDKIFRFIKDNKIEVLLNIRNKIIPCVVLSEQSNYGTHFSYIPYMFDATCSEEQENELTKLLYELMPSDYVRFTLCYHTLYDCAVIKSEINDTLVYMGMRVYDDNMTRVTDIGVVKNYKGRVEKRDFNITVQKRYERQLLKVKLS